MKKAVRNFSKKHDLTYTQAMDFLRDEASKTIENNPGIVNSFGFECDSKTVAVEDYREIEAVAEEKPQIPFDLNVGGSYMVDSDGNVIDSDGNSTLQLSDAVNSILEQISIVQNEQYISAVTHLSINHDAVSKLNGEDKRELSFLLKRIELSQTLKDQLIINIMGRDSKVEKAIKFCRNDILPVSEHRIQVGKGGASGIHIGTNVYSNPVFFSDYDNIIMSVKDKQESSDLREMLSYQIRKSGTKRVLIDLNNKIDFTVPLAFHQEILEFRGEKYQDNGCIVLVDLNNISKTSNEYEDLDFYMNPFFKASVLSPNKVSLWIIGNYKEFLNEPANDFQKSVNEKIIHIVDSSFIHINSADPSDASQMFGTKFLEFDGDGIYRYKKQVIRFNDK